MRGMDKGSKCVWRAVRQKQKRGDRCKQNTMGREGKERALVSIYLLAHALSHSVIINILPSHFYTSQHDDDVSTENKKLIANVWWFHINQGYILAFPFKIKLN